MSNDIPSNFPHDLTDVGTRGPGRPAKYGTDDERRAARRERDRKRKQLARDKAQGAPPDAPPGFTPPGKVDAFAEELAALQTAYKEAGPTPNAAPVEGGPVPDGEKPYISGYVLLMVADVLFPPLVGFLFRRDVTALRLTKEERDKLEPIADRAAMDVLGGLSPTALFFSTTFAIYAGKAQAMPKLPPKVRKVSPGKPSTR